MEIYNFPGFRRGSQPGLQPQGLLRVARDAVGLVAVTVYGKEVHRAPNEVVITFVTG